MNMSSSRGWRRRLQGFACLCALMVASAVGAQPVLSVSPSSASVGQTVTLSATAPAGPITFKDGSTTLGTAPVVDGVASLQVASFGEGTHSLTAIQLGNATWNPADKAASVTLTSGNLTAIANANGSVRSIWGATSGKWYFEVTCYLSLQFRYIGIGTHDAGLSTFPGDDAEGWSILDVSGAKVHGGASTDYAGPVSSQSVISVLADLDNHTLSFRVDGVDKGVAFANLPGTKPFYAMTGGGFDVPGDGLFGAQSGSTANFGATPFAYPVPPGYTGGFGVAGTSATVSLLVKAGSSTTLVASPTAPMLGQNVTLAATVMGRHPGGTVTFSDAGTVLGSAPLGGGVASLSVNSLALGSHSLSASYSGDANNGGSSTASPVALAVGNRAGFVWQYGYDAMGRPNTVVDSNGLATYVYYDALGRPIQTQQPPNSGSSTPTVTQYGYDAMDALTSVADPRNLSTTYARNGLGDTRALSSPDSGNSQHAFDAKGNLVSSTDARGKTTTFAYDALDRVVAISYPSGTGTTFEYDGGATPTPSAAGELTKMTDASGQTVYAYDSMGRLGTKTVTIGAKVFKVGYAWGDSGSALDKLTAITYPSGARVNYSYDQFGSVSGITVNPPNANGTGTSAGSTTLLGGITYNADNQVTGWQWSDGKPRTIAYDANGMVASYTLGDPLGTGTAAGLLRTLTRDPAGRITGYTHTNNGSPVASLNQGFGYDDLNRLTSQTQGASSTGYSYDETGNRTSKTIGGTVYANTIASDSNRLTQAADVTGTASIGHDTAGHVTSDGTNAFTYSDRGRMATASNAGGTVSYAYNGLEQRASKSGPTTLVPTGAAYYVYDEAGQLLGEYDANGTPLYETVYLGSSPVGVLKQSGSAATNDIATTLYNAYADQIDTVRLITRQDHAITWRWDTAEAFGATAPDQNPSGLGAFVYNPRFPGQVFDQETGLAQNWHREYQARWGRYAQSDPIGLSGGVNTFSYVGGAPLTSADPTGLQASDSKCTWVGPVLVCQSVPSPTPDWTDPTPSRAPLSDLFAPSPLLPTWNWDGIKWPDWCDIITSAKPPKEAYNPKGAKAPGKPGPETGFKDPKKGDQWVRNPGGPGYGWLSGDGTVWVPTGPDSGSTGDAHGGSHWDVQTPDGRGGYNMYPGGRRRDRR